MDYDTFYLGMAEYVAQKSKDPSTKVGCVIVRPDRTVASLGFNGFPRGTSDHESLYADKEIKYSRVIHAEENAILAAREPLHGYTAYVTHPPCMHCSGVLIQSGIKKVIWIAPHDDMRARWGDQWHKAKGFLSEAGVEYMEV